MLFILIFAFVFLGIGEYVTRKNQISSIKKKYFKIISQYENILPASGYELIQDNKTIFKLFNEAHRNGFFEIKLCILQEKKNNSLIFSQYTIAESKQKIVKLRDTLEYKNLSLKPMHRFSYIQFFHPLNANDNISDFLIFKHKITSLLESEKIHQR